MLLSGLHNCVAGEDVQQNGNQNDQALDHLLPECVNGAEVHNIVDDADHKYADDRANHIADATGHGGPAQHTANDCLKFKVHAASGKTAIGTARIENAGKAADGAHNNVVDKELFWVYRKFGGFLFGK